MKRVYLDQMMWINLAKAAAGRKDGDRYSGALQAIRYAAKHGLASFPLSRTHYEETKHMPTARQRYEVGRIMLELSRGHRMIGPSNQLVQAEFESALYRFLKKPLRPPSPQVFGKGLGFVYERQIVGRIQRKDGRELTDVDLNWALQIESCANALAEELILCGPPEGVTVPDYDPQADRAFAEEFVLIQEEQATRFQANRTTRDRIGRVLTAAEWIKMAPLVVGTLIREGIDPEKFFQDPKILTALIEEMPVVNASLQLRRLQHENSERQWKTNDYYDIEALSVGVVHCDIIVTERHWAHMLNRAQLSKRHQTIVLTTRRQDLSELIAHLAHV
jgi:hypothetical protein